MAGGGRSDSVSYQPEGKGSAAATGSGGGAGGSSGGGAGDCPLSLPATLVGPVPGACSAGDVLDVVRMASPPPARVVCVHRATGVTVGAVGGVPGLGRLLECLDEGVAYEADVVAVAGGRIDVVLRRI